MKPLIIALDVDTDREAMAVIKATSEHADIYKVGPTLVLRYGPAILKKIHAAGKRIFLDLKFHDIPNTMLRSVTEAGGLGLYSVTVHSSAGSTALRTVANLRSRPKIWGVTVLTSFDAAELASLGVKRTPAEQVMHLAALAQGSGLDGIVASVEETAALRRRLGARFTIVTPGIRLSDGDAGDQKRVATPSAARHAGASFIVVGRPILEAKSPAAAAAAVVKDWKML